VGIDGEVEAGVTAEILTKDAVGWTGPLGDGASSLSLQAGDDGVRLLLYADQPQNISIVAQAPCMAGSREELAGFYAPIVMENFRTPARCGQLPSSTSTVGRFR
jgi:redox-sensitive bicupin YhaK (pirin superfamily)